VEEPNEGNILLVVNDEGVVEIEWEKRESVDGD